MVRFFFQAEDGIRDVAVTGVQTCALPILLTLVLRRASSPMALATRWSSGGSNMAARAMPSGKMVRPWTPWRASAPMWQADRESVVEGKRVDLGGCRVL